MQRDSPLAQLVRFAGVCLGTVIGIGALTVVIWRVPLLLYGNVQNEAARVGAEATTRTGLLTAAAGVAAVTGLIFTSRTYRLSQQSQFTDRYTKAIEQLGKESAAIRLGGIYALERIAIDSARDRDTVFEVLAAFLRESATNPKAVSAESQAALSVIGRMPRSGSAAPTDLSGLQLGGCLLNDSNLSSFRLSNIFLSGARAHRINLSRAWLYQANLSNAHLVDANLSNAYLRGANLTSADLEGALLKGADLTDADLSGARAERTQLAMAVGKWHGQPTWVK